MFSFFREITQFLQDYYYKYLYSDGDEMSEYLLTIITTARAVLEFVDQIAFAPLGLNWLYPVLLVTLFFEWRSRHKGKGI